MNIKTRDEKSFQTRASSMELREQLLYVSVIQEGHAMPQNAVVFFY